MPVKIIKQRLINGLISTLMLMGIMSVVAPVLAQGQGQICIRNYDDRNANATYDPGEPLITRGITANLLDSDNVIVRSVLLEDSPQATQGLMCFQTLNAGQYTVQVASADYSATTADTFVTAVTDTSIPQVFEFGAQVIILDNTTVADDASALSDVDVREVLERVFLSGIGAIVAIGAMIVLGTLIYYLFLRQRQPAYASGQYDPAQYAPPQYRTGEHPATSTGQHPASKVSTGEHAPATGSYASAGGYVSSAQPTGQPPKPTTTSPDVDVDTSFDLPDWDDLDAIASSSTPPVTPPQGMPAVSDEGQPPRDENAKDTVDEWLDDADSADDSKPTRKDESKGFDSFTDTGNYDMYKPPQS